MRTLNTQEMQQVSGGTLCLIGGLIRLKVSLLASLFRSPCKTSCQPAPKEEPAKC